MNWKSFRGQERMAPQNANKNQAYENQDRIETGLVGPTEI